jgi:hypothetical protein
VLIVARVLPSPTPDQIILSADSAKSWILKSDTTRIGMRFVAAPVSDVAHLVIALRIDGKGIDLLVPYDQCEPFRQDPTSLLILAQDAQIEVPFDNESFDQFVQQIPAMHQNLPEHTVWRSLYEVFGDE